MKSRDTTSCNVIACIFHRCLLLHYMMPWNCTLFTLAITTSCTVLTTLMFISCLGNTRRGVDTPQDMTRRIQSDLIESADWQPIEVVKEELFIQSAIVNHHRSISTDVAVVLTAWYYHKHHNPFLCCFPTPSGHVITVKARFMFRHIEGWLGALQFVCYVSKKTLLTNRIYFSTTNCVDHVTKSLPIVYPERGEGKMAVCIKTIYNKVSPEKLIEWFELQKLQGVHKIQGFHFKLEKEGLMVLEYYKKQGYLILLPINCPVGLAAPPGRGYLDEERPYDHQFQADEQIGVFDCNIRLSGYDYVGVYDVDEVVVPAEANITLPNFLKKMIILQPEAGAFKFHVKHFVTNWGKSNNRTDLNLMSYVLTKEAEMNRMKIIHMPPKTLWQHTHLAYPVNTYTLAHVNPDVAAIHHYRSCRYKDPKTCELYTKIVDRQLLRYEHDLKIRVDRVKQELKQIFKNKNIHTVNP